MEVGMEVGYCIWYQSGGNGTSLMSNEPVGVWNRSTLTSRKLCYK